MSIKKIDFNLDEREIVLKYAEKTANLGFCEWDYKSKKTKFSDGLYDIFGIYKLELKYDFEYIVENFVHPKYKTIVFNSIKKALDCGIIEKFEYKIIKKNKEERWIRTEGIYIYDEDGNKIKMISIFQDITEWKKNEIEIQKNLDFLQTLIDAIPNPIFYKDKNGIYKYSNAAHIEYLGLKKENIIGQTIDDIIPKGFIDIHNEVDKELLETKDRKTYECKLLNSEGVLNDVVFIKSAFTNKKEEVSGIVGVMLDITDRKKSEERINRFLKLKDAMLDISHSIIEINDINDLLNLILDKIIESMGKANSGCILVLDKNEELKIAVSKGYDKEYVEKFDVDKLFACSKSIEKFKKVVILNDIKNKSNGIITSIIAKVIIENELYGVVNIDSVYDNAFDEIDLEIMEYITNQLTIAVKNHRLYEKIKYLSRYDKLTNIYNRTHFEEVLKIHANNASKFKEKFYLAVFDLNVLKCVNDKYGHLAGDEIIKSFVKALKNEINDYDTLGRFGGDEFVAVFFDTNKEELILKFEDLLNRLKNNPIIFGQSPITCSFSYGVAEFPNDSENYIELIKIADKRMYEYKNRFKQCGK